MRCQLWWWNVAALTNYHITLAFGLFGWIWIAAQLDGEAMYFWQLSFYSARSVLHLGLCLGSSPVQVLLVLNCCCKIMPGGVIHLYFKEKKNGVVPKKGAVPIRGAVPIFLMTANRQEKSQNCNCAHTTVQSEGTLVHHLVFRSTTSACQTKTGCFQRLDVRAGKMKFVLRCAKRIGRVIQIRTCFTYWTGLFDGVSMLEKRRTCGGYGATCSCIEAQFLKGVVRPIQRRGNGPFADTGSGCRCLCSLWVWTDENIENFNLPLGLAKVNS